MLVEISYPRATLRWNRRRRRSRSKLIPFPSRPDNCDGTYEAYCDVSRERSNIREILQRFGQTSMLSYMDTYWKSNNGDDQRFWSHEWDKHGTCISTLETKCYTGYTPDEDVVGYFNASVSLFKKLDSYAVRSPSL